MENRTKLSLQAGVTMVFAFYAAAIAAAAYVDLKHSAVVLKEMSFLSALLHTVAGTSIIPFSCIAAFGAGYALSVLAWGNQPVGSNWTLNPAGDTWTIHCLSAWLTWDHNKTVDVALLIWGGHLAILAVSVYSFLGVALGLLTQLPEWIAIVSFGMLAASGFWILGQIGVAIMRGRG